MAKKVDPLKAKQARQKKIAIGGGVLLLAVMGFQVPRTMKMLKGPPASTAPAAATTNPAAAAAAPAAAPAATVSTPVAQPATARIGVIDPAAPTPVAGQLVSFDRFESKDPFVQQLREGGAAAGSPEASQPVPDPSGTSVVPPSAGAPGGTLTPTTPASKPVATAPAGTTAAPRATAPTATPPASAVISINGIEETVPLLADFPKLEPVFRLAALTRTSAKIAIAGGSYATGAKTVTLVRGKPLTLMNTTDGTRYELRLLTVA